MDKLINKLIIYVFFGISFSSFVAAEDLLFEDGVLFEGLERCRALLCGEGKSGEGNFFSKYFSFAV